VYLAVLLMSAVVVLVTSLLSSLVNTEIAKRGDWHFYVVNANQSQIEEAVKTKKIAKIATRYDKGYSLIEGDIVNEEKPYVHVTAVTDAFYEMMPFKVLEGRIPENENEIVIPVHFQNDYNLSIGDIITLNLGERIDDTLLTQNAGFRGLDKERIITHDSPRAYTIVGICEVVDFIEFSFSPGYTALTFDSLQDFSGKIVYFKLKNPKLNYSTQIFYIDNVYPNRELIRALGIGKGESIGKLFKTLAIILAFIIAVASYALIRGSLMISIIILHRGDERSYF
jgi:putative ABC transport system permease protein